MTFRFRRAAAMLAAGVLSTALLAPALPAQAAPMSAPATVTAPAAVVLPMSTSGDSHTKNGAKAAFKRWFGYWNDQDWAAQYDRLVFEQQALVTEDQFIAWRQSDFLPTVKWVKTLSKKWTHTTIPGTDSRPKCVKVKARVKVWGVRTSVSSHWVYQDSHWRWMLTQSALDDLLAFGGAHP
jgi:hypothetical protein